MLASVRASENTVSAKLHLQTRRQLEHATLALNLLLFQILFTAAIGNVFAKDHNAVVVAISSFKQTLISSAIVLSPPSDCGVDSRLRGSRSSE